MPDELVLPVRTYQVLSGVLICLLILYPRHPVFLFAIISGLSRSIFMNVHDVQSVLIWDVPTTALRLAACAEAWHKRTMDVTRRRWILLLCLSISALFAIRAWSVSVSETEGGFEWYTHLRMVLNFATGGGLLALVVFASFPHFRLRLPYPRDHAHVALLMLWCLNVGLYEATPQPSEAAWRDVNYTFWWSANAILLGWVVCFGQLSVIKKPFELVVVRIRKTF